MTFFLMTTWIYCIFTTYANDFRGVRSRELLQQGLCCRESGEAIGLLCGCRKSCAGNSCDAGTNFRITSACGTGVCCCGNGCIKQVATELDSCPTQQPTIDPTTTPSANPTRYPTLLPTEAPTCLLADDELEFDFRGVIFQEKRGIINCPPINSNDAVTQELQIDIETCDVSLLLCPNITTNGLVSLMPNAKLFGEIQAQPFVITGDDIVSSPHFISNTSIQIQPTYVAAGSIMLKPTFETDGSFIGIQRMIAGNNLTSEPTIDALDYVVLSPIIEAFGNVTLSPNIKSNGPVIIYSQILQSANIFINTVIDTPDDVIIISKFITDGIIENNAQINGGIIKQIPIGNSIFLAPNFLMTTVISYSDFRFIASLNTIQQFDNTLLRFVFGFNILDNNVKNIIVTSNYLDINRDGLTLGIIDENNVNHIFYQQNLNSMVLNQDEMYLFDISFCNKSISLTINDDLILQQKQSQLFDHGKIGIYGQQSFLKIDNIQCVTNCI